MAVARLLNDDRLPPPHAGFDTLPLARRPLALIRSRRFAPFFWVQFSGALNDNIFKVGFTSVVTYQSALFGLTDTRNAAFLIAGLFVLPFLLFSATAGQLADRYDKATLMRWVKSFEIGIMVLASIGFLIHDATLLYFCVFLMGTHSTIFGPAKYAYLPENLAPDELVAGNGLVEMGTFVSILIGTVMGGMLASRVTTGGWLVAACCLVCALTGRVLAIWIPSATPAAPELRIHWNPISETWRNLALSHADRTVFTGLIGISWLWFVGAVFLTSFFSFTRDVLHGDPTVVTLLLATFTIGIGVGSILCSRVGGATRVLGLVPVGGLGMSVFALDLYLACRALPPRPVSMAPSALFGILEFVDDATHWRVLGDLLLLALAGGLYSVPLYALIQQRSEITHRARIIAANNILNALFMVGASVLAMGLAMMGADIPTLFLIVGGLNVLVILFLCWRAPTFARHAIGLISDLVHSRRRR